MRTPDRAGRGHGEELRALKARPIFVGGTSSQAGKSWMATAICAWLRARGCRVAPFKAQNMSNNSGACPGGGEIGRAQIAQAEACGLEPETDMNPILLKPHSDLGSQVVLEGRVWGSLPARDYYQHFDFLLERVLAAYARLAERFEYVVIEGAGSVAELNLASRDLCNLGLARRLHAPGLLVADIDRGGVFASIVGTYCVLPETERALLRSFAVNRFRGDISLFDSGVEILEARTNRHCLGVFPMAPGIELDPEDGVCLEDLPAERACGPRIAIVRLPHISNFTDFRLLTPFVSWITRPVGDSFDCVILPGTKNTVGDLAWLRRTGLAEWTLARHAAGTRVIGICGGYQMMGESVADPLGVESNCGEVCGLSLLPVRTALRGEKTVRSVQAATPSGIRFDAYEIHMGETERPAAATPFATLADGTPEGIRIGRDAGTYLHGALECTEVASELLGCEIPAASPKQHNYQLLAEWFDKHQRGFAEIYL
jgi:adenosylcobyric acid synthase